MYKSVRKSLQAWNATNGERSKLQHTYLAIAVITILVAGLLGLLDYNLGQQLTAISMLALGMFFVNLIVWTLLSGIVLAGLDQSDEAVRQASATTRTSAKTTSTRTKTTPKK